MHKMYLKFAKKISYFLRKLMILNSLRILKGTNIVAKVVLHRKKRDSATRSHIFAD